MRVEGRGLIDRSKPIGFSFNGRQVTGYAGDTIASALMAEGVKLMGPGHCAGHFSLVTGPD